MFHSIGENSNVYGAFVKALENMADYTVTTSGSTGSPKQLVLTYSKIKASAEMTNEFFGLTKTSKILNPLSNLTIGGLMMIARAFFGEYEVESSYPTSNPLKALKSDKDLIAMVPLHLHEGLIQCPNSFERIRSVLVGGGTITEKLEKSIRANGLTVFNSFGMTETYSHIALRKVGVNQEKYFQGLPGTRFSINANDQLIVECRKLLDEPLLTNDLVELLSDQQFVWKGRADLRINTGGIKVGIEELEAKLHSFISEELVIWKEPDPKFGERIVLLSTKKLSFLKSELLEKLANYEIPKRFYLVPEICYSAGSKPLRERTYSGQKTIYEAIL